MADQKADRLKEELLLEEYRLCQEATQSLEATIWQTASLMGVGSVGSLILISRGGQAHLLVLPVGLVAVSMGFIWWSLAKRWWTVQHSKFTRMYHIEQGLRIPGQVTYLRFMDSLAPFLKGIGDDQAISAILREYRRLVRRYSLGPCQASGLRRQNLRTHYLPGPRRVLQSLPWLNLAAWLVYLFILASLLPF